MKSAEYMKINPSGVVPTLVDDDLALPEGMAILLYLVGQNAVANIGPAAGTADRVELHKWLVYISGTLHPYFWPHFMPMRFTTDEIGHAAVQKASHKLVDKALTVIDQHLEGRDWMVGDSKSVADAFLYPFPVGLTGLRNQHLRTRISTVSSANWRLIRLSMQCTHQRAPPLKLYLEPDVD